MGKLSDVDAQKAAARKKDLAERQYAADLVGVMSQFCGRRVMWRILSDVCGLYSGSYSPDASAMAYAEGRRSIGIALLSDAQKHAPLQYAQMLREIINVQASEADTQEEKEPLAHDD